VEDPDQVADAYAAVIQRLRWQADQRQFDMKISIGRTPTHAELITTGPMSLVAICTPARDHPRMMRLPGLLPGACGPVGYRREAADIGWPGGCAALVVPRAPGHEPHDDEDGHRDQPDDKERPEHCEDPGGSRDGKPDGEDRAEDCPDDPAHAPSAASSYVCPVDDAA
jgi:hypothetical protein